MNYLFLDESRDLISILKVNSSQDYKKLNRIIGK
ncbi:hypothetical protein MBFIL_04430 [Methanobrevibacter filiformis]|uniref:Uncharacterized protein n=1 Tax=Methanobrevibacter filiformis TaxID=55758 RepID=A0A166ESE6_9EURY|nr:hypothetical protein MBFIL_04430 [Methanobrevibacter filiformis]